MLTKTEGDPENDGLLEAREIMNLSLNADLALLSACETANGRIAPARRQQLELYPACRCRNAKVVWLNSSTFSYSGACEHPSKINSSESRMFSFSRAAKRVEVT